jgi:hypothetical protein
VIERVREAGGHFRSLGDPIDTAGPSGMLVLQIMGALAQFERALIVERTKAGLAPLWPLPASAAACAGRSWSECRRIPVGHPLGEGPRRADLWDAESA